MHARAAVAADHGGHRAQPSAALAAGMLDHSSGSALVAAAAHGIEVQRATRGERVQGRGQQGLAPVGQNHHDPVEPLAEMRGHRGRITLDNDAEVPIGDLYRETFQKYIESKFVGK